VHSREGGYAGVSRVILSISPKEFGDGDTRVGAAFAAKGNADSINAPANKLLIHLTIFFIFSSIFEQPS
jgi:hypothetical protein